MLIFSRVATKSVSAYNMMYVVRAAGRQVVNFFVSTQYLKNEMSDLNETWYTQHGAGVYLVACVETKKVANFCSIFRSCDLDL
jgi:hypothetical protein